MSDLNISIIKGRLTADPDKRTAKSGTTVTSFSIANNIYAGGSEDYVNFFDCVAFAKKAEVIADHFHKGSSILIRGEAKQERWETSEGKKQSKVRFTVLDFDFLDKKSDQCDKTDTEKFGGKFDEPHDSPFDDSQVPF